MSQKKSSSLLRLKLNRNFDSIWYKESQFYANALLSDYSFRNHLKKSTANLQNTSFGRNIIGIFPKQNDIYCSILTKRTEIPCYIQQKSTPKNAKSWQKISPTNNLNSFLTSRLLKAKKKILGISCRTQNTSAEVADFPTRIANFQPIKKKIEVVNQLQNNVYSNLKGIRSTSLLFSANFLIDQLGDALKKNRSILPAVRICLKLAQMNPNVCGVRIVCSGRFRGIDRARTIGYSWGQIQRQKISECVDYACESILTKAGLLGVKVWICYSAGYSAEHSVGYSGSANHKKK